jgi:hypothetical protein
VSPDPATIVYELAQVLGAIAALLLP